MDYLIKICDYDFVSAVCHLINERPLETERNRRATVQGAFSRSENHEEKGEHYNANTVYDKAISTYSAKSSQAHQKLISFEKVSSEQQSNPQSTPKLLTLPRRNKDNFIVISYLLNRGIDKELIKNCINSGILYECAIHHNAVFLGKDENGKTQFAAIRGTVGDFKRDADGSNKSYGFVVSPENPEITTVIICESPIDCLSYKTLCKRGDLPETDGWLLSLGGTSLNALTHFLDQHTEITHCIIATDADNAGNTAAQNIEKEIAERNTVSPNSECVNGDKSLISTERSPPLFACNDINSALMAILQAELTKNKKIELER